MSQESVYIVDDDHAVRRAVTLLLESVGYRTQGHASAREFLDQYLPEQPGCLVLDVRMPGMSGLELQQELNRRGAILPIIFITGHGDVQMAVDAMKQGAFDFVQKPFRDQDLLDRVNRALQSDQATRKLLARRDELRRRVDSLTPREREVMNLVVEGRSNKLIGGSLEMSERTVEIHRARVMEKMGARSLAQLVRMALELEDPQAG